MSIFNLLFRKFLLSIVCLAFTIIACTPPTAYEEAEDPNPIPNNLNDEGDTEMSSAPKEESVKTDPKIAPPQNGESSIKKEVVKEKIEEAKIEEKIVVRKTGEALKKQIKEKASQITNELFEIYEKLSAEEKKKFDKLPRADVQGSLVFLLTHEFLGLNLESQEFFDTLEKYYSSPCRSAYSVWNFFSCTNLSIKLAYIQAYRSATSEEIKKLLQ